MTCFNQIDIDAQLGFGILWFWGHCYLESLRFSLLNRQQKSNLIPKKTMTGPLWKDHFRNGLYSPKEDTTLI